MSSPNSKEIYFVRCIKCGKIMKCSRYDTSALLKHIRQDHPEVYIVDIDTKQRRNTPPKSYKNSPENTIEDCQESDEEKCRPDNKGQQHVSYKNAENEDGEKSRPSSQRQYVKDLDLSHHSVITDILEKYPEIKESEYTPHNPNAQVIYTRRYRVSTPSSVTMSVLQQPFQSNLYRTSIEKWRPAKGSIFCPKCGCNKKPLIKEKSERFSHNEWTACCFFSCWPCCFLPWILPASNNEYLYCANCKTFLGLYDHKINCIRPNRLYVATYCNNRNAEQQANKINQNAIETTKLLENESPPPSLAGTSAKSKGLPSITVDGKELPPETVARIQKLKKFSPLIGLDLDALTTATDSPKSTKHGRT